MRNLQHVREMDEIDLHATRFFSSCQSVNLSIVLRLAYIPASVCECEQIKERKKTVSLPKILTDSSGANTPSTGLTEYFMGAFVLNLYPTGDDDRFLSLTFETWPGETLDAISTGGK